MQWEFILKIIYLKLGDPKHRRMTTVRYRGSRSRTLIDIETQTVVAGDQLVAGWVFDLSSDPLNLNSQGMLLDLSVRPKKS
jgi:hypothetical protein